MNARSYHHDKDTDCIANMSPESRKRFYLNFYSAYAINLTANPEAAERQERYLEQLEKLWGLSANDVAAWKAEGDRSQAGVREMIDFYTKHLQTPSPSLH